MHSFNVSLRKANQGLFLTVVAALFAIAVPASLAVNIFQDPAQWCRGPAQTVNQEELLWWLPADTESVIAARGPFEVPATQKDKDDTSHDTARKKVPQSEILREFERQSVELLYFHSLDLPAFLRGSTVAFAMQGSRHFREPLGGAEVMSFEGCSIVVFGSAFGERGTDLMQSLARKAGRTESVAGISVVVFQQEFLGADYEWFVSLPRPNVLLVANNLVYLREVLERMTQRKGPRALPAELPEWRFLETDTRFWALRHYDRTQAKLDPTSPFGSVRTFGPEDQQAVGVIFALQPGNQRKAVITSVSGDDNLVEDALRAGTSSEEAYIASLAGHEVVTRDRGKSYQDERPEPGVKYEVALGSPSPGVLQTTYTVDRVVTLYYFVLKMEVGLGRGMYF